MLPFPKTFVNTYGVCELNGIIPQIDQIIGDCIASSAHYIQCPNKNVIGTKGCYKLLGFDILCREDYQVFLAETNVRVIQLQYPPPGFKKTFYANVLKLVLDGDKSHFRKVVIPANTDLSLLEIVEGFNEGEGENGRGTKIAAISLVVLAVLVFAIVKKKQCTN
jgi:hypothetical protein